jgi:hypothetical protein
VVLDGRSYYSPGYQVPIASFYFWQNGIRTKFYEYKIFQDDSMDIWHFGLRRVIPQVTVPLEVYPLAWRLSYDFVNNTLSANCATDPNSPTNATTPCMQGSFNPGSFFSFSINDTRTNTVSNLRAVDKDWAFSNDAPSFILRDVQPDDTLGDIAVRTAVTQKGNCTALKLCLARPTGMDMLAPLGLALLRQDGYAKLCTTPDGGY